MTAAEKKRAYQREWYLKNKERHAERGRKYYQENKARLSVQQRRNATTENGRRGHAIAAARHRAAKRGIPFDLSVDDLEWPTHCPVLGIKLSWGGRNRTEKDNSPSLDRVDNTKGYTKDNVRVISQRANALKGDGSVEEIAAVLRYMQLTAQ